MGRSIPDDDISLVEDAIRRLVLEAIQNGGLISISHAVAAILKAHPNSGLSERGLSEVLMMAAAKSGVPVEFGREKYDRETEPSNACH